MLAPGKKGKGRVEHLILEIIRRVGLEIPAPSIQSRLVHGIERPGNRHDRRFQVVRDAADHLA